MKQGKKRISDNVKGYLTMVDCRDVLFFYWIWNTDRNLKGSD